MRKPWVLAMLEMGIFAGMWAITVLGISVPSIHSLQSGPVPSPCTSGAIAAFAFHAQFMSAL